MRVDEILQTLASNPTAPLDIAEVALHLASDEYPQMDVEARLAEIDGMAHEARRYIRGDAEARLHGLRRYLFHDMGFRGNVQDYYDPANSYLNMVLERRTGIPISLCAVVMAVGPRAGLPIHGVGLPGHFIAKAEGNGQELLFDPFHGGRPLRRRDCETLVEQVTRKPFRATPESLRSISMAAMVQRMLNNLKAIYVRNKDFMRGLRVITRLQQLNPSDPMHHLDIGACYLHLEQPGKALSHLQTYLDLRPQASADAGVRRLLDEAKSGVARLN